MELEVPDSILEELDRIDLLYRDRDEQYRRWLALWQQHLQDDKILTTNLYTAVRITESGALIALLQDRHYDALDLFTDLSHHPEFAQIESTWLHLIYAVQMQCLLRLDRETQAVEVGYELLRLGMEEEGWQARNSLCSRLLTHVKCGPPCRRGEEEATEEFTRLVVDTLRIVDPQFAFDPLPPRATYEQLDPLVTRTVQKILADQGR